MTDKKLHTKTTLGFSYFHLLAYSLKITGKQVFVIFIATWFGSCLFIEMKFGTSRAR